MKLIDTTESGDRSGTQTQTRFIWVQMLYYKPMRIDGDTDTNILEYIQVKVEAESRRKEGWDWVVFHVGLRCCLYVYMLCVDVSIVLSMHKVKLVYCVE